MPSNTTEIVANCAPCAPGLDSVAGLIATHFIFPDLDQSTIDKLATRLGEIVCKNRPRFAPSSFAPSVEDVHIVKQLFLDEHPTIALSKISVKQAFTLLTIFHLNNSDLVGAQEAYAAFQNANDIAANIKLNKSRMLGARISARNRYSKELRLRDDRICQLAGQELKKGLDTGTIARQIARRNGMPSLNRIYEILRKKCKKWPYYRGQD
jgi:hypothetical protein